MYGIPNMKLEKDVVERRVRLMSELGIEFVLGTDAADHNVAEGLLADFDAVVAAVGARAPRGLAATGFEEGLAAGGVAYAVDYLTASTRALLDGGEPSLSAAGLDVVVIGGGDTGNDCMGTAVRPGRPQRAAARVPAAPGGRERRREQCAGRSGRASARPTTARPRPSSSWAGSAASGRSTRARSFSTPRAPCAGCASRDLDWSGGRPEAAEGSEREMVAQLVLVACGFTGPERGVLEALGVAVGERGLPVPDEPGSHRASAAGKTPVFLAGGRAHGPLAYVVSAIADAMACAAEVAEGLGV